MPYNYKIRNLAFPLCFIVAFLLNMDAVFSQAAPLKTTTAPVTINRNIAVANPVVAFKANATYLSGEPIASGTPHDIDFTGNALFNESNSFSIEKDEFTAPANGYYHFDVRVGWNRFSAKGDVVIKLLLNWYSGLPAATWLPGNTDIGVFDTNFSSLMQLKAGDKVRVQITQDSGAQQTMKQVQFSGFKVN
jgi:C1q domain